MSALDRPTTYETRLAELILAGSQFTMDDITMCGKLAMDTGHLPNGAQNGLGTVMSNAQRRRLIRFTGQVVPSCSPTRKKAMTKVWEADEAGWLWARSVLCRPKARLPEGEHRELTVDEIHRLLEEPEVP